MQYLTLRGCAPYRRQHRRRYIKATTMFTTIALLAIGLSIGAIAATFKVVFTVASKVRQRSEEAVANAATKIKSAATPSAETPEQQPFPRSVNM